MERGNLAEAFFACYRSIKPRQRQRGCPALGEVVYGKVPRARLWGRFAARRRTNGTGRNWGTVVRKFEGRVSPDQAQIYL